MFRARRWSLPNRICVTKQKGTTMGRRYFTKALTKQLGRPEYVVRNTEWRWTTATDYADSHLRRKERQRALVKQVKRRDA